MARDWPLPTRGMRDVSTRFSSAQCSGTDAIMNNYEIVQIEELPYLYVERTCSTNADDLIEIKNAAFSEISDFIESQSLADAGNELSVYFKYEPDILVFRAGVFISPADMNRAIRDIHADMIPSGKALKTIHKGAYTEIEKTYDEMMNYIATHGVTMSTPTWEVYLANRETTPEEDMETAIFISIA